jgi:hypothetical protein
MSCGCWNRELNTALHTRHGHAAARKGKVTALYRIWSHMIGRCHNPKDAAFANYGGRGIVVCDRWRDSYTAFMTDVGPRPSSKHTLDRIDNNGGYKPGNVRWATRTQQMRNVRYNRLLTLGAESLPMAAWAERLGIKKATLADRLYRGWSDERALTTPVAPRAELTVR